MKSKSLEMILDNMYFIASVDEKEEKVFVALDFEEAGRKYAELKSEGDAIIWHLRKKDLGSRIECDFGTPMEMVSEERLLRLMSLVVVEGKDSPSVSPTVGSGEKDRDECVHEPARGRFEHVLKFDLMSVYESVIMSFNLSPETLWRVENSVENSPPNSEKYCKTPGGNYYCKRRKGTLPMIIEFLMDKRDDLKGKRGIYDVRSPEYDMFNDMQRYYEEMMNSFSGVLIHRDFGFWDTEIGKDIVVCAREIMEWVVNEIEELGYRVVYTDIGNVFVQSKITNMKDCKNYKHMLDNQIVEGFNLVNDINNTFEEFGARYNITDPQFLLQFDKIYKVWFHIDGDIGTDDMRKVNETRECTDILSWSDGRILIDEHLEMTSPEKEEIMSDENSEAIVQSDWDIEMGEDDEELQEIIEEKSMKRFKSQIRELLRKYDVNVEDLVREVNKFKFNSWFWNLPLNIRRNVLINSTILGGEEDIELVVAYYLVKLQIQSGDLMDDILRKFREIIEKSEYKDIKSKVRREKIAARAVRVKIVWERKQKRKSSGEELPESIKIEKDSDQIEMSSKEQWLASIIRNDINQKGFTSKEKDHFWKEHYIMVHKDKCGCDSFNRQCKYSITHWAKEMGIHKRTAQNHIKVKGELDQRSTPGDLVDEWKERQEDMVSTPKVKSSGLKEGEKEWSKEDLITGISEILKREKGPMSRKDIISKVIDIDPHNIPLHTSNLFNIPIKFLIDHSFINRVSRGMYKWIGVGKSYETGPFESFLGDWCFLSPKGVIIKRECWDAYLVYCQQRDLQPVSEKIFSIEMKRRNIKIRRRYINDARETVWIGLDLIPEERRVYLGEEIIAHEVDRPESIPSMELLLEGFDDRCKMRGMTKKSVHKYVSYVKIFIEFVEKIGESILDVDERTLEEFKSYLRDNRGFKKATIGVFFTTIRAFYDYTNFKGITDVSEPISHGVEEAKLIPSIPGLLKGFADNCKMKGTNKKDVSRRTMQARAFIDFVKGNSESILEVDEQTLEGYKSYLKDNRGFKEATIESHSVGIHTFYNYTNSKGFTDVSMLTKRNRYISQKVSEATDDVSQHPKSVEGWVKRAGGEKSTDRYPRTHLRWAERAVGKGGDLTRTHIDMSNESFEPNFRYIYKGVVQGILDIFKESEKRRKEEVMRIVLNIPEGNEIPSGASFFIQVHLKFMVEHDFVKRIKDGVYGRDGIRSEMKWENYIAGNSSKWNQIPYEEESLLKSLKSVDGMLSEVMGGEEYARQKNQRTEKDWVREILGDDLQRVDIEDIKDGDGKRKNWRTLYTGINQKILLELENKTSVLRSELTRSLFDFEGSIPKAVRNIMDMHLRYLVYQGYISRIQTGVYTLVVDDKGVVNEEVSASITKDEKTSHRELSVEDWIRRITKGEKPYAWISYGSMDDTRVVQRGQGTPIYPEINRRIMVEVRASKDPIKRSELIRPVFDLGWDERIPQVVNTILNNHLRYLIYKNVLKQPARGYYKSVPDNVPDYRVDLVSDRKIHEGVMDRTTRK